MNVVLIGFRGSGKTSVGKALAERLKREFIDCDEYIEKQTGHSIREIFEKHGESHFRTIESQAIGELAKLDGKVIATGGGAVLKYQNVQVLRRQGRGVVFFLEVGPETAFERIQADQATRSRRPALTDKDPFTEVREQIEFRGPYYRKGADYTVPVDGKKLEDVVGVILGHLKEHRMEERDDLDEAPA
jgi:shikimate kinase